tara:strand:- start:2663 stop:2881 length:219 start_codon:yes stop_codon:yes gene_type:complete
MLSAKEKILLGFLGAIFTAQVCFLGTGVIYCMENGGLKACPEIGKRVEMTFAGMTATVLALITNIGTGRPLK